MHTKVKGPIKWKLLVSSITGLLLKSSSETI